MTDTMAMVLILGGASLLLTLMITAIILPILRAKKIGQTILEEAPETHKAKAGTPTMGGICFICAFLICILGYVLFQLTQGSALPAELIPLALTVCLGVGNGMIGYIDDYTKLIKKRNKGLSAGQKMVLQILMAGTYLALMAVSGNLPTVMHIPFSDMSVELGYLYYVVALLFIVGFVNATNLTDGVDGLASSVGTVVAVLFIALGFKTGNEVLSVIGSVLCGGLLGFLYFNVNPARIFMGDTGSLFIGGIFIGGGFMIGEPLVIILASLVFIAEMLSSLLQVIYFKMTHGKRIFKKAPLHHHFEESGWSEPRVVFVFTLVSVLLCIAAYFSL